MLDPHRPDSDHDNSLRFYEMAVDEVRFQVVHNWSRTQYLLAFNVAILTAGIAVSDVFGKGGALVFFLGAAASALSAMAVHTQHDYYRAARDRMRRLESFYGVPEEARVNTTSTLGNRRQRTVSVTMVVYLLLGGMAVADVLGLVMVLATK